MGRPAFRVHPLKLHCGMRLSVSVLSPTLLPRLARTVSSAAVAAVTPRRSALYIPGSNLRALEKAKSLPVDTLILDLEDAVAPENKALARTQVVEAVRSGAYGRLELVVRINARETAWGRDDLEALCGGQPRPPTLLLPKAERVESVEAVLSDAARFGCTPGAVQLWCMVETPLGVLRAEDLAAHPAGPASPPVPSPPVPSSPALPPAPSSLAPSSSVPTFAHAL